ncbi:MAG: DUF4198 domain-containing protein [Gemmataceae bacterium]|nr:DUF4198 domain-containing protein [Gemmataceae bacterium]MCI0742010.1 DUF4198 domain-containing protein [Gemmataceae bacterium]
MAKRWRWLLVGVALLAIAVWGFDAIRTIYWVGSTDLHIHFEVSDADSGKPVENAEIYVQSEGGFYKDRDEKAFTLTTDRDGIASGLCRDSMCFGTRSGLRFTDTFRVYLPWWRFQVIAEGYEPHKSTYLDIDEYICQVQRTQTGTAKLTVPISIKKSRTEDQP